MEITRLQRRHIPDVVTLWNNTVQVQRGGYEEYTLTHRRLTGIMESENFLPAGALVAFEDGMLAGFAMGYVQRTDFRKEGNLEKMPGRLAGFAVHPDYWRKGIGRGLLGAVEAALAEEGKSAIAMETYRMPIYLANRVYLDSGPYHFLLSCGYKPLGHELSLYNDISTFQLRDDVRQRRRKLTAQGFTFRWYEPADRENLIHFMARYFTGGWYAAIERAIEREPPRKVLLAVYDGDVVGFTGPFYVGDKGEFGGFGSPGVHPNFRRLGIGTVLFNTGFDYLKRAGAGYTSYSTGVTNPARFMYYKTGAQVTGVFCCNFRKEL